MDEQKILDIIYILNSLGRNIIFINNRYYDYTGGIFEPYNMHVSKTVIKGRDITNLLKEFNIILTPDSYTQKEQLIFQIEKLYTRKIEFSNSFSHINYLAY